MESISQLREICQYTRSEKFFPSDWLDRNIFRKVSIYLTWLFLKVRLSPNKLTLLGLLSGIVAGAFFTMPQAEYWLVAWGLLFIREVLDCCDGEVARYRGTTSLIGEYNDGITGEFPLVYPFLFACMSFGIYRALESAIVFIFGFALVIGWVVFKFSSILCLTTLCMKGMLQEQVEQTDQLEVPQTLSWGIIPYGRALFNRTAFFFALLIISLLDMFIPPFSIGSFYFNARLIYLALFALAVVFGTLLRVYDVNRHGVTLHK